MLSNLVQSTLAAQIADSENGVISFAKVMEIALYLPGGGYYSGTPRRIGRKGDFYTSVSVGPLYGKLLATSVVRTWGALGRPPDFSIVEQGAHDGQLMEDLHQGLLESGSPLASLATFLILEPQEGYRKAQSERLQPRLGDRLRWESGVESLADGPQNAFFVTNELLDAFPVHRVQWTGEEWIEIGVGWDADSAEFIWRPMVGGTSHLKAETDLLPRDLPVGHTTEVQPAATDWVKLVGRSQFKGSLLVADYGLDDVEYDSIDRPDGTLRRYWNHQMDSRVLEGLGECDLTTHLRFTRVLSAAAGDFEVSAYLDQGRFLTKLATPWLKSLEGTPASPQIAALLRQFHTLTHPGQMGTRFRMCLLTRGLNQPVF
jgi:SAM-dependent MidA family methyltransferase